MPKTYRVTSETVNFSLVVPDSVTSEEVNTEVISTTKQILAQQREALAQDKVMVAITEVPEEEEDGPTLLGRLVAGWFRSQQ